MGIICRDPTLWGMGLEGALQTIAHGVGCNWKTTDA